MNRSGLAVRELVNEIGIESERLVVVHDDLDLELGRIRLRRRGGAGGHNGIRSIISELGTEEFQRVQVGIGRPPSTQDSADYVLSPFVPSEVPIIENAEEEVVNALECLVLKGMAAAMNQFNIKKPEEEEEV